MPIVPSALLRSRWPHQLLRLCVIELVGAQVTTARERERELAMPGIVVGDDCALRDATGTSQSSGNDSKVSVRA